MIFADKLIELRKKSGMTQEELAEHLNVSRQSVSKWEGAQSVPDLDKVLKLSKLFGVTTDYLLKEELELPEIAESRDDPPAGARQVTMEEANAFLAETDRSAGPIALGVMMCILSPVCLLVLSALAEAGIIHENLAGGLGVVILLALVAGAVALFLYWGAKTEAWEYLEKEPIETAYGVDGMVRERRNALRGGYILRICLGVGLCILCPTPVLLGSILTENDAVLVLCACALLVMVALGVGCIVAACIPWGAMQKLLQEGDYTPGRKRRARIGDSIAAVYWCVVTAGFLAYSFVTGDWGRSWIIWPVAAVLFGAVTAVCSLILKEK